MVDGKPLVSGTLNFTPLETNQGPTVTAETDKQGIYHAKKVPVGKVRVVFHGMQETGKTIHDKETGLSFPEAVSQVPQKYQSRGIEVEIASGQNKRDFELNSNAK